MRIFRTSRATVLVNSSNIHSIRSQSRIQNPIPSPSPRKPLRQKDIRFARVKDDAHISHFQGSRFRANISFKNYIGRETSFFVLEKNRIKK